MNNFIKKLYNKHIVITGATGMIGSALINELLKLNNIYQLNMSIYGYCRNFNKFKAYNFDDSVIYKFYDLNDNVILPEKCNYIIHTASPTSSDYFITNPVETMHQTYFALNSLLEQSKNYNLDGFIYLSSLEVYGICNSDKYLKETELYNIDISNVRSSYSEGKRFLELVCHSYYSEYNIPVRILRLGQCFGKRISDNDKRVFAYFYNCVKNNNNIILSTDGSTKRSYLSIDDCINGILVTMLNGKNNEVYNLASDNSYLDINDLAILFISNKNLQLIHDIKKDNKYLESIKFGLDTSKIKDIGFKSIKSIKNVVEDLINE